MKKFTFRIYILMFLLCGNCISIYAQDTLAYWGFNEGAGSVAKESISNTDFIIKSKWPVIEWVPGIRQNALRTDGYTVYADGSINTSFPVDSFSVTAWIAPDTYPVNTAAIWSNFDAVNNRGAVVALDKFGRLSVSFTLGALVINYNSDSSTEHGKWNFIAVDIDAAHGKAKAYVNAIKVIDETFTPGSLTWPVTKTFLGRSADNLIQDNLFPNNYLNAIYDEIIIRKKQLTESQIASEYASLKPGADPDMTIPASRFANDFYRPKYHAVPKAGWGNESHGLVYYNGLYYMFYQKNGNGPFFGFQNWGHFTSNDLINWKEEVVAIWPKPGWESVGNWSGHLVVDNSNVAHIIYTAVDGVKAGIGEASSTGNLLQWNKNPANPLIPGSPAAYPNNDFRDPYVFKEGNAWYMIVGSGLKSPQTGTVFLYKSADLKTWQLIGPMFIDQSYLNDPGLFWEMPVFWKFGNKYMLLVNKTPSQGTAAKAFYWVGNFANETFTPTDPRSKNLELINQLLSPTVNLDAENKTVAIGIIPDLLPGSEQYNHGWANVFSLPRRWEMIDDTLYQSPHPNLAAIRSQQSNYSNITITPAGSNYLNKNGWQLEIKATINPGTAKQVGFIVDKNANNTEYTKIYYDYQNLKIVVDHSKSSANPNTPKDIQSEYFLLPAGQPVEWDIFMDGSVIDVFINNKWAFATRAFPVSVASNGVDVFASGGNATLTTGSIWTMNPAILPAKWLSFTATKSNNSEALLEWKVANEVNNKLYAVERSTDGKNFKEIAVIAAAEIGENKKTYSYTDHLGVEGVNYYRIKQVDKSGAFTYSSIQSINFYSKAINSVSRLAQNPASRFISVVFSSPLKNTMVNVYDATGKLVWRKSQENISPGEIIYIPAIKFAKGLYILAVNNESINETHKVIVQ